MKIVVEALCSGSVDDLQPVPELEAQLRRADDFIRLAALAAHGALGAAGAEFVSEPDRGGLLLGTAHGPMQTNFAVLDQVASSQPVSPTLFSHSVFNGAAGYLARLFKVRGCALTCTDFSLPFLRALEQARTLIFDGLVSWCLVLQVESYSTLLEAHRSEALSVPRRRPGAVCWLLRQAAERGEARPILEALECQAAAVAANRLDDRCRLGVRDREYDCADSLEAVALLSKMLTRGQRRLECSISSDLGDARLVLQR